MCSLLAFLSIFTLSDQSYAHQPQEGKVLGTIGPFFSQTHAIHSQDVTNSPPSLGFGVLGEGDLSSMGGIEIGLFYSFKTYERVFGASHLVERVHKVEVPVGYRHWLLDNLSAGIAFSSSFSVGDPQVVYADASLGSESTLARDLTEYGINFSVQWEFWTNNLISLILDGRYSFSLSAKTSEDANQYGLMLGMKYLIQEK